MNKLNHQHFGEGSVLMLSQCWAPPAALQVLVGAVHSSVVRGEAAVAVRDVQRSRGSFCGAECSSFHNGCIPLEPWEKFLTLMLLAQKD